MTVKTVVRCVATADLKKTNDNDGCQLKPPLVLIGTGAGNRHTMDFFRNLPKIELHAHLNGSLSNRTLTELGKLRKIDSATDGCLYRILQSEKLTLEECFQKFQYAHVLTDRPDTLAYATEQVIRDFADDNVVYLELRTTPKTTDSMSKRDYLTTVINTIRACAGTIPSIVVKLLPSIDRSKGVTEADENVSLVLELQATYPEIIKGLDLSGNPFGTKFADFRPALERARLAGLRLALHCGEFEDDQEVAEMFDASMDRIGHGTFVKGKHVAYARERGIPVECCLTSNVKCKTVSSYDDHHFGKLLKAGVPVCVCTDDFGVFETNLSQELRLAAQHFHLSHGTMVELQEKAIAYAFASEEEKIALRSKLNAFKCTLTAEDSLEGRLHGSLGERLSS